MFVRYLGLVLQTNYNAEGDWSGRVALEETGNAVSGRRRLLDVLAGKPTDRPVAGPLAVHFCAQLAGMTILDYSLDPQRLAESVVNYYERFRPDAVWVSADTWVTAEALGAEVDSPGPNQPICGVGRPLIRTRDDLHRLPRPAPHRLGRQGLMIEAVRRVSEAIGDRAAVVACFDQFPFSLASALVGSQRLMLHMVDDPSFVRAVMEPFVEHAVAYGRALGEAGADVLSGGDSPAGLIGPARYREFALPFERRVIEGLRETGKRVSLHICGDATPILPDMVCSQADILELDHQVDMSAVLKADSRMTVWGNLDPVGVLERSTPELVADATRRLIQSCQEAAPGRLVVSSGCTLAVDTPPENVRALLSAAQSCD